MAKKDIDRINVALGKSIEQAVKKLTARCFQALVSATPVDTGFARAGWSPSTGNPAPGPSNLPSPRSAAETLAQSLLAQHGQAAQAIESGYKLPQGVVFIVNPVHYVQYLNAGTSAQAPALFVENAITTAVKATQLEFS